VIYVDTNVVVAYINKRDPLHMHAVQLVEELKEYKLVVSDLVLVELYAVYSRTMSLNDLELEALVEYSITRLGADVSHVDCTRLLSEAQRHVHVLRLKTLDLLHVVSAYLLGARGIATFDKDIIAKRRVVEKTLGLEVYTKED
jgi:predicted nucleic acid-binding protein